MSRHGVGAGSRLSRRLLLSVGLLATPLLGACSAPDSTNQARSSAGKASPLIGPDITHGPADTDKVALTFHGAGDETILARMLADFAGAGAKVTVLAIGEWLATTPTLARAILDGGHELGNHTWSHRVMTRLSAADVSAEVDRAAAELRTLTGSAGRWFRPSGTPTSTSAIRAAASAAGYGACLGYDVDPLDYTDPGAGAIAGRFASAVQAGSIVSLHLGHQGTLDAMPSMLATLQSKRLQAVTMTELLT